MSILLLPPHQYDYLFRKASFEMWKKYGINKAEMKMLNMILCHLQWKGKVVCGRTEILKSITGNPKEKGRMMGMVSGLKEKGFIGYWEYKSKPGSCSIGLMKLGVKVLNDFEAVLGPMCDAQVLDNRDKIAAHERVKDWGHHLEAA